MAERKRPFKALLKSLPPEELVQLLLDLHQAVPAARRFIDVRLLGANPVELAEFKREIAEGINPDAMKDKPLDIRRARKAISEFRKACGPGRALADLMLFYVEAGTRYTLSYGDIDGPFYSSLCSMYNEFEEVYWTLSKDERDSFVERISDLDERAGHLGWGYGDFLQQKWSDLVPYEEDQR